ncbi:hypothetical protein B0H10DRAFT_2160501 [Mycena sp. CBHHK59/15]|nr:hypothetical protein B0H10DRAFT_2160501 [Mycena sp. CBHHK59/15]
MSDVEQDPTTKKVRCLICKEGDPTNFGKWIAKASLAGHLKTDVHESHLLNKQRRIQELEENARKLREVYSGPEAPPIESEPQAPAIAIPSMFEAGLTAPIIPTYMTVHDPDEERNRLRAEVERMLSQSEQSDEEDDITLTDTVNSLKDLDLENEEDEIDDDMSYTSVPLDSAYSPYPNKVNMLLDIIDNLPRLRMSSNQFKMILWILKKCNVSNLCGSAPKSYTSTVGNRFFVNDIRETIARDFANPEVAKHLQFYPEATTGPISEVWQAQRWKEFKPSELTPMYARGLRQFYIDEVAALESGALVIPVAWIKLEGVLCANCVDITTSPTGWTIGVDLRSIPASEFRYNYYDVIERIGDKITWADNVKAPEMPNALRALAEGDDLYVVMVPIWADDVSGNKSKQYNKHINMYLANSNLPGQLLQQEYFVRFVSTSPHATSPEQFSAIKEQIQSTHTKPIPCYNAETGRNCRVILRVPSLPADNPQQSEEASHMGGNANCGCRRCKAGGPHEVTESDDGYHSMHNAGIPRLAAETKKTLEDQIKLAMYGVEAPISRLQTATGVKDKVAQYWIDILLQKAREMKANSPGRTADSITEELEAWLLKQLGDKVNPLLDISGLDPNRDTPVEILHTILLGIIKYVWYILHSGWSDAQRDLFVIRLQSTDIDGLTIPPIRSAYMMQYRNGLIGKHFKTLMQTMVFHMHDLVSPELFTLVKAVSALGSLLWVHEIDDMDQYTSDLTVLIGNVLDAFGDQDPAKILLKIKLHLLPHIVEDAVLFECFNAIFRLCSILSNHQAPSHDIALKFASMDRVKHMLSGGFWKVDDDWVCAGPNVRSVLKNMPIIQHHLGWVPPRTLVPGNVPLTRWKDTQACSSANNSPILGSVRWRSAIGVTAQSGDFCREHSWIFARDSEVSSPDSVILTQETHALLENAVVVGRICELLAPETSSEGIPSGVITLDRFVVSEILHPDFGMPVLQKPADASLHTITVLAAAVMFRFSAQHDCRLVKCAPTALRPVMQERQETSQTTKLLSHGDDEHFVVNMAALHNATLLRRNLPVALTVPQPLYADRQAHHHQVAIDLHAAQTLKRARTQEKRRATLKVKKIAQRGTNTSDEESEAEEDNDLDEEEEVVPQRKRQRVHK